MSTHKVEVIRIAEIVKHPNADSLGLVQVWGFTAIVRLGDFQVGDLAAYIEPDYVVPETEQFAFLAGKTRIRARRLRGVWSQGLLIKAPVGAKEGDCVMERLGIKRYEPPMQGQHRGGPGGNLGASLAETPHHSLAGIGVYDLENWRRHRHVLEAEEPVVVSEKVHGSNARYAWRDGRMWVGSRTQWKRSGEPTAWQRFVAFVRAYVVSWFPVLKRYWRAPPNMRTGNVWWRVLDTHRWIIAWCKAHPDCVLYGEVFGDVQDLKYGAEPGQVFFRAFDVLRNGQWVDAAEFVQMLPEEHRVPVLYWGPYHPELLEEMSRRDSTLAKHLSEGIVVKPEAERHAHGLGRVALKLVSDRYLERAA